MGVRHALMLKQLVPIGITFFFITYEEVNKLQCLSLEIFL
jgi:hypothetical protein